VPDNAQARFDATERTYDYFIHGNPDAWLDRASGQFDLKNFAPARVARALPTLLNHQDFRALCIAPDRHNTTIVHFREASLFQNAAGDRFRLRFVANRFLRGMIRLLVHHLVQIGNGTMTAEEFAGTIKSKTRSQHFRQAPPEGLYLTGVRYPYLDQEAQLPPIGGLIWMPVS
jgi:tRNA pseudouridine38-40 synthase